jgi:mycothiol synthase
MFDTFDATYGLAPGMDLEAFRQLFGIPGFDPEHNTFLIFAADGELAGYGDSDEQIEEGAVTTFGRIHPDHLGKGLGGWLFRRLETRAVEIAAERPLALRATALELDTRAIRLFEMLGYSHVRDFWHMERSLEDLPQIAAPPGVTIRTFREGDARSFHRIEVESFRGQWGTSPLPFEDWAKLHLQGEGFSRELWFIAECDGRDAGIVACRRGDKDGWVASLGVLEEFRGRGIGGALLRHVFHMFRAHGYRTVALNVDSNNPTGATKLYEAQGMRVRRRWAVYDKASG